MFIITSKDHIYFLLYSETKLKLRKSNKFDTSVKSQTKRETIQKKIQQKKSKILNMSH